MPKNSDTRTYRSGERSSAPAAPPPAVGRYRVDRLLGEGGFGCVYLGYDDLLQRFVAIKVPHRWLVSRPENASAYLAEARAVAALDHPNIVPVYDVGSTDEWPCYIVSKFIDGTDLAARLRQVRPPAHEAVALVAAVADALHHAHTHGLVHRDVKPGNILLDRAGKPYAVDFGLALRDQDAGRGPRFAGTPPYMSPEQARGEGHRVDRRTDVFSLGVVLYELLTGRRPFAGDTDEELLEQITRAEPRPPRLGSGRIPPDLERVCLKALSQRAADRYPTAKEMADELRHCLGGLFLPPGTGVVADTVVTPDGGGAAASDTDWAPVVPKGLRAFDAADADFFLHLVPGPRDRHGLPDVIRFWKGRVEAADGDDAFPVGILYGPSGCGKSSLVQAGLLPRLAPHVRPVYLEATPDLDARLLSALIRAYPELLDAAGPAAALAAVRRGDVGREGEKTLIVLDQFEQWLHAHPGSPGGELVRALRQCDGGRLQCLLLVRDDFWAAAARFLRALEVPVVEGRNAAAVDLFPPVHARKVLAAFGRAYGTLPPADKPLAPAQAAFLDRAVAELTRDGWVVPVRLAVFADLVRARPWTGDALRQLGGAVGIGVKFLDETFEAPAAPPEHWPHLAAVRAVLKILLPHPGSVIRGHVRSRSELLEASGYVRDPVRFDDLMRILTANTRLLTPTAPDAPDATPDPRAPEPGYQLTHDYLVPSIREWLGRAQRATRRGRAEIRLAERGALWQAKPEDRQLPSLAEWLSIRLLTTRSGWTDAQRRMMRAGGRKHLARVGWVVAATLLLATAGLFLRREWAEERAAAHADGLVRRLLDADVAETPRIVDEISTHRRWADPRLERELADPTARRGRHLRARLALLPVDPRHVTELRERLLEADAYEFPVIRNALAPYRADLIDGLWEELGSARDEPRRFRAAAALATYAPADRRWDEQRVEDQMVSPWVAKRLVSQPSLVLPRWVDALRPIKERLTPALSDLIREPGADRVSPTVPAEVLTDYAAGQPDILAGALADAGSDSFHLLFQRIHADPEPGARAVESAFNRVPAPGGPAPNVAASRRANLAIALLRLSNDDRLWPLLKASPDPRVRGFLIDRLGPLGCDPAALLARLNGEPDDTIRAALWLALGAYDDQSFPSDRRAGLTPRVQDVYRQDPSAAVHAAAFWLLGKWGARDASDRPAADPGPDQRRGWRTNPIGQTLVRIDAPGNFAMGAAPDEPGYKKDFELRHTAWIDRPYEISMTEVTVAQFRQFLEQRRGPGVTHYVKEPGLPPDAPAIRVSWYDAAAFCNWLSEIEQIPADQWCYEPNKSGKFENGMKVVKDYRLLRGYRLPVESEWEYACRGGAATSRCYGDADELLRRYAWYAGNSVDDHAPVARLLPNAFGLFDMHGNATEWCQNLLRSPSERKAVESTVETISDIEMRAVRGGRAASIAKTIRSAKSYGDRPSMPDGGGFRVVRTISKE